MHLLTYLLTYSPDVDLTCTQKSGPILAQTSTLLAGLYASHNLQLRDLLAADGRSCRGDEEAEGDGRAVGGGVGGGGGGDEPSCDGFLWERLVD